MAFLKDACWAIMFIIRIPFPPGKSLASILQCNLVNEVGGMGKRKEYNSTKAKHAGYTQGSPEINGNIFFLMNMYIHICIIYACAMNCTQSPTVLITHGQPLRHIM